MEEIRQLGSGTYGAVYHGKWKGSDVAIKRIKASCFSGKPTERERMVIYIYEIESSFLLHLFIIYVYSLVCYSVNDEWFQSFSKETKIMATHENLKS